MPEEIRDLIEKINQDGIRAAEEKARTIEAEAKERADAILVRAKKEAEEIISAANERICQKMKKKKPCLPRQEEICCSP